MSAIEMKVDKLGRVVVPCQMRRALGIGLEQKVQLELAGNMVLVMPQSTDHPFQGNGAVVLKAMEGLSAPKAALALKIIAGLKDL